MQAAGSHPGRAVSLNWPIGLGAFETDFSPHSRLGETPAAHDAYIAAERPSPIILIEVIVQMRRHPAE